MSDIKFNDHYLEGFAKWKQNGFDMRAVILPDEYSDGKDYLGKYESVKRHVSLPGGRRVVEKPDSQGRYLLYGCGRGWDHYWFTPDSDDEYGLQNAKRMFEWLNDEWSYVGVKVTASLDGVVLGENSLWGVESDSNEHGGDEDYFAEVAGDCAYEAIHEAKTRAAVLLEKLKEVVA